MLISDNQIAVWNIYDKKKDLELLNKILSNSMKKKIALHLSGTGNKLKLIDNLSGEREDFPIGITIEIYTKDDRLMMQMIQS